MAEVWMRRLVRPKAEQKSDEKFKNRSGYWVRGQRYEHREVYKAHHGWIPKGWVVHHIDCNHANNAIDNLIALPADIHDRLHAAMRKNGFVWPRSMIESFMRAEQGREVGMRNTLKALIRQRRMLETRIRGLTKALGERLYAEMVAWDLKHPDEPDDTATD